MPGDRPESDRPSPGAPAARTARVALAGDTMLGRGVAARIRAHPRSHELFSDDLLEVARAADALVLNLECCISERGERWPDPAKPFFFRAPPAAVDDLLALGVDCVTLANNHALDYGVEALHDTLVHLDAAGIAWVGAGPDRGRARAHRVVEVGPLRLAVVGLTDHPREYEAGADEPGVAYADIGRGELPAWVRATIGRARDDADLVLVSPHWGPNMTVEPVPWVRRAGPALLAAGASLVAGHSAHLFHGVAGPILWDLGDFLDDYAVDPVLRNDRGLLWIVELDEAGPRRLEAVPLQLEHCRTRLARGRELEWIIARFRSACERLGTPVAVADRRLAVELARAPAGARPTG